jgi:hypothetical protein
MTETPETQAPAEATADAGQAAETGQGAETTQNWYNSFEGEDLGYIQNKGWAKDEGVKDMLNSYKNLEKMRGVPEDRILKLPEGEDPEGWNKIYEKLGKPSTVEEYAFQAPEGAEIDNERLGWFSNTAHELNLNKQQHNKLVQAAIEYENNIYNVQEEKAEAQRVKEIANLKDRWGAAYEEKLHLGKRAFKAFASESAIEGLEKVMGSNAEVIEMFSKIGESISEDNLPQTEGRQFGQTKEQMESEVAELKNEVKADPIRLAEFNKGKGADYEKLQRLRGMLNNG